MFNLEQAITQWRRQMQAAAIKTPEHLDELESHFREELAAQVRLEPDAEKAFELAVQKIGRAALLKAEFAKVRRPEKFPRWETWLAGLLLVGLIMPVGIYALLKFELSPGWRLLGVANLAVLVLAVAGRRRINGWFPVIADQRVRRMIGLSLALAGMAGMILFMNVILPRFDLTMGQVTVVVLWGVTLMTALGAVWAGLDEAARRQITNQA
jgi:hypothetical protein